MNSLLDSSDVAATKAIHEDENALSKKPSCPKCRGIGYYVLDVPVHDPNFGVLMTCQCKQIEKDQRAAKELRRLSNLDAFQEKTFEAFDRNVEGVQRAYRRAREYARNPRGWLVLFGTSCGCGKTHLAAAIANQVLERHYRVLFMVVPDLLDHLRRAFAPNSGVTYDELFETIREVPLLVLDDLGTENTTPWAREKLYQIINHRYNYKLATVITTNSHPNDIDPRILSRMYDPDLCEENIRIEAGDYRRTKARSACWHA